MLVHKTHMALFFYFQTINADITEADIIEEFESLPARLGIQHIKFDFRSHAAHWLRPESSMLYKGFFTVYFKIPIKQLKLVLPKFLIQGRCMGLIKDEFASIPYEKFTNYPSKMHFYLSPN